MYALQGGVLVEAYGAGPYVSGSLCGVLCWLGAACPSDHSALVPVQSVPSDTMPRLCQSHPRMVCVHDND